VPECAAIEKPHGEEVEVRFLPCGLLVLKRTLAIYSVYAGVAVRQAPAPFHSL
jgi:hypothetical protein